MLVKWNDELKPQCEMKCVDIHTRNEEDEKMMRELPCLCKGWEIFYAFDMNILFINVCAVVSSLYVAYEK